MDSTIHDLPPGAVQYIVGRARGRRIPGTNRYAIVCKGWQEASPDDDEQLQLYLDKAAINGDQLQRATQWLAQHGKGVAGLELPTTTWGFVKTTFSYPGISSSLQRLDVRGTNTLVGLLAARVQLPHLQHLTACISQYDSWQVEPGVVLLEEEQEAAGGVHPLQQACPGLRQLYLGLDDEWGDMEEPAFSSVDTLLPRLLPPTLQQLLLDWSPQMDNADITPHLALGHVTALQRLELCVFRIRDPTSFLQLPPGCELGLVECWINNNQATTEDLLPFRGRLTALRCCLDGDVSMLSHLTRLTSLWVGTEWEDNYSVVPLVRLTAMQQLYMEARGEREERAHLTLRQAANTRSLQRLVVSTSGFGSRALLSAVGALTQLTLLCLSMDGPLHAQSAGSVQGAGQRQGQEGGQQVVGAGMALAAGGVPVGPLLPLHRLVGLTQLRLTGTHLLSYPNRWLSHLTQLTLLVVVDFRNEQQRGAVPPGLSNRVEALVPCLQGSLPASLQQLVLCLEGVPACDVVPSPLPGVAVGVRPRPDDGWFPMHRVPRPMQPCAHLPGVWELLPEQY